MVFYHDASQVCSLKLWGMKPNSLFMVRRIWEPKLYLKSIMNYDVDVGLKITIKRKRLFFNIFKTESILLKYTTVTNFSGANYLKWWVKSFAVFWLHEAQFIIHQLQRHLPKLWKWWTILGCEMPNSPDTL